MSQKNEIFTNNCEEEVPTRKSKRITCRGLLRVDKDFQEAANIPLLFGWNAPHWYVELSDRQMKGADSICLSVAEDSEQGTVYRSQQFLFDLGIYPIPSKSKIRQLFELSHLNDIAFLWYMYIMHFASVPEKTKKLRKNYNYNERIILSAICHLDMVTTLKALHLNIPIPAKAEPPVKVKSRKAKPIEYISPYLEPMPRPIPVASHSLPMPNIPKLDFKPYHVYKDPNHVIENEQNRWYADHLTDCACDIDCELCTECSRLTILAELCPLERTKEEYNEFADSMFNHFVSVTKCHCDAGHKTKTKSVHRPIHYSQLHATKTNEEFANALKQYVLQVVVKQCARRLFFSRIAGVNYLAACVNCKQCQHDYMLLNELIEQQPSCSSVSKPYDSHIHNSVFGELGPEGLIRAFDKIAERRAIVVHACVKDLWKYELYLWSDCVEEEGCPDDDDDDDETCDIGCDCAPKCECALAEANPRDSKLMTTILRKALKELQADSKYALACLPQAHKVPLLREWIKARFGLVYTRKEREDALAASLKQWSSLDRSYRLTVRVPTSSDVCMKMDNLHYGHMKDIRECLRKLNRAYYHRLSIALVNDARRLWPTLNPFLCPSGPPRSLFYAYMPATLYDPKLIKPWQLIECKNMVLWTSKTPPCG